MAQEPGLVYEEDKVVLELPGVRKRSIVSEVEVIGLVEVVEGDGERGSAGKVEKGGVVEGNWGFPLSDNGFFLIFRGEGCGKGEGDREFGWDICILVDFFSQVEGGEGGEGGGAGWEFRGGGTERGDRQQSRNIQEERVTDGGVEGEGGGMGEEEGVWVVGRRAWRMMKESWVWKEVGKRKKRKRYWKREMRKVLMR